MPPTYHHEQLELIIPSPCWKDMSSCFETFCPHLRCQICTTDRLADTGVFQSMYKGRTVCLVLPQG